MILIDILCLNIDMTNNLNFPDENLYKLNIYVK